MSAEFIKPCSESYCKVIAKQSQVGAQHYISAISTPDNNPLPTHSPEIQTSLTYKDPGNNDYEKTKLTTEQY